MSRRLYEQECENDSKCNWRHSKDSLCFMVWLMMKQDKPDNYILTTG